MSGTNETKKRSRWQEFWYWASAWILAFGMVDVIAMSTAACSGDFVTTPSLTSGPMVGIALGLGMMLIGGLISVYIAPDEWM